MSLSEIERMQLECAIASTRFPVPLNGCRELDVDGVCDIIKKLGAARDDHHTGTLIQSARYEREAWLRQCAEKDVEREKQRGSNRDHEIADLTAEIDALKTASKKRATQSNSEEKR